MQTSKARRFWTLYKKELRELAPDIIIVIAASILLNIYMYYKMSEYSLAESPFFAFSLVLTCGLAGFLPLISSFKLSREWSNQTVYLIMSLPVSGASILGAKLLALLTQLLIGGLAAGTAGAIAIYAVFPEECKYMMENIHTIADPYTTMASLALLGISTVMFWCCVSFLAQVIGKLVHKYSGVLTAVSFIAIIVLINKGMGFITAQFNFDPAHLNLQFSQAGVSTYFCSASIVTLIVSALLFTIAAVIYDRKLEL